MIELRNSKRTESICIPSNVNEITNADLKAITDNINLPKEYCLIALCATTRLFDIAATIKSNKIDNNISIIPIMAKIKDSDVDKVNAKLGERVILSRSSIELGTQVYSKTAITMNNIRNFIANDNILGSRLINGSDEEAKVINKVPIIALSFKMIPLCDVHGSYNRNTFIDPYKKILVDKDN